MPWHEYGCELGTTSDVDVMCDMLLLMIMGEASDPERPNLHPSSVPAPGMRIPLRARASGCCRAFDAACHRQKKYAPMRPATQNAATPIMTDNVAPEFSLRLSEVVGSDCTADNVAACDEVGGLEGGIMNGDDARGDVGADGGGDHCGNRDGGVGGAATSRMVLVV